MTLKKMLLTVAAGAMLAAPVALACDECEVKVKNPCHTECEIKIVTQTIWIPAQYRLVCQKQFIPAQYRCVSYQEWIAARYECRVKNVWVPPQYCHQRVAIRNACGQIIGWRMQQVLVRPGHWVSRTEQVLVPGTGMFVTRMRQELVPGTGLWVERQVQELVPGTGVNRTIQHKELVCGHKDEHKHGRPLPSRLVRATGFGAPRADLAGPQAKILALRAARLDAARKLAEELYGLKLRSETTVRDMVTESDLVASKVSAFLRGAREVEAKENADGSFSVTLELGVESLETMLAMAE